MFARMNYNNSILSGKNAMPMKDGVADGTSDFAQNRSIYTFAPNPNSKNLEKKWIGNSASASNIITNKRVYAIGKGSVNQNGALNSYVNKENQSRIDALRRVRSQGHIVPAKVTQKNITYQIKGIPTIQSIVVGDGKLHVYFTLSENVPSYLIVNYRYSIDGGKTYQPLQRPQTTSPIVIDGLTNGTTYSISIQPYNTYVYGTFSNIVTGTPIGNLNLPIAIGNLNTWLDSQSRNNVIIQNNKVVGWNDKTTSINNYTNTIPYNITSTETDTINTRPAINFTTTNISMLSPSRTISGSSNTLSVFMIVNHVGTRSTTQNSELFLASDSYQRFDIFSNTQTALTNGNLHVNMGYNTQLDTGVNIIGQGPVLICAIMSSTAYVYVDGNNTNVNNTPKGTGTYYDLNGTYQWRLSGAGFTGFMGEVLVYNSVIGNTDRQKLEGYLSWKWGLQNKLPSNHPYKNNPP